MRKLFTDFPIGSGAFELSPDDAHHVLVVLRHTVGDSLAVTDSTGTTYECLITGKEGHAAFLTPVRKLSDSLETAGKVILAAGLLKSDKLEWVIQKATELGVSAVVPVQMAHCVVKLSENRVQSKVQRWQRIAEEAAKQCGRSDIPDVMNPMALPAVVDQYKNMKFVVPYEQETAPLRRVCQEIQQGDVVIVIGPEGGFARTEIDYIKQHVDWCRSVSLGPRILRAETASLAALSIVMYERGFK